MIKKCVILILMVLITMIPAAYAEDGGEPLYSDGAYVDFAIDIKTEDIYFEEAFIFELTVSNLSDYKIEINDIIDIGLTTDFFSYANKDWNGEYIVLDAHETVTAEITGKAQDYNDWYEENGQYYIDFQPEIVFYVYESKEHYYSLYDSPIKIKLNNIYDGNEHIKLEWADSRVYKPYYSPMEYDPDNDGINDLYYFNVMGVHYRMENISDTVILDLQPGESAFHHYEQYSEIKESQLFESSTYRYSTIYELDGKYYALEMFREYDIQIIEPPIFELHIIENDDESTEYIEYDFELYNPSSEAIEDCCLYTYDGYEFEQNETNDSLDIFSIMPYETKVIKKSFDSSGSNSWNLRAGYYIEGMFYGWKVDVADTEQTEYTLVPVSYVSAFPYAKSFEHAFGYTEPITSEAPTPEIIASPTARSAPEITASPTPGSAPADDTQTAETNKLNISSRIILLIVCIIIVFLAIGLIAYIKTKDKEQQND